MSTLKTLTVDDITLNIEAMDWEDAIRKAAAPMLARGDIEARYIDAMVESVKKHGPYIVLSDHVALAHARPEDGCVKTGLYFTTLSPEISFGSEDFDPVRLLIVLSAADSESHVGLLADLSDILGEEEAMEALMNAESKEAFLAAVKSALA